MLNDLIQELRAQQPRDAAPVVSRRLYEAIRDGWLEAQTITYDEHPDLPGIYFRVSELHQLCPRLVALARREPLVQVHGAEDLWVFGIGRAYHTLMQGALAALPGGVLRGWWRRDEDGHRVVQTGPDGAMCARPDGEGWRFEEVLLHDADLHLCGHGDGVIAWPDGMEGQEFKTIHSRFVNRINPAVGGKPLDNHLTQVHGYMLLMGIDRFRITYILKTSDPMELVLFEHEVRRDERIIEEQRALLHACAAAREIDPRGLLPAKLSACTKASCARAQRCPGRMRCFKAL